MKFCWQTLNDVRFKGIIMSFALMQLEQNGGSLADSSRFLKRKKVIRYKQQFY